MGKMETSMCKVLILFSSEFRKAWSPPRLIRKVEEIPNRCSKPGHLGRIWPPYEWEGISRDYVYIMGADLGWEHLTECGVRYGVKTCVALHVSDRFTGPGMTLTDDVLLYGVKSELYQNLPTFLRCFNDFNDLEQARERWEKRNKLWSDYRGLSNAPQLSPFEEFYEEMRRENEELRELRQQVKGLEGQEYRLFE